VLMLAAALKLILLDFGSLGQIANILAMMGGGGVFLLVAWLAPFPPRNEQEPTHKTLLSAPQTADKATGGRGWLWIVAALAVFLVYAYWFWWPMQRAGGVPIEAPPPPLAPPLPQSSLAAPVFNGISQNIVLALGSQGPTLGRSLDVTGIIRSRCQGATDVCTVHCGNELAGDPDLARAKAARSSTRAPTRLTLPKSWRA
jgi:hypothetical protein